MVIKINLPETPPPSAPSANEMWATVQALSRAMNQKDSQIAALNERISALSESCTRLAYDNQRLRSFFREENNRLTITHPRELKIDAPRVEFTSGGMGCTLRANCQSFEVLSVSARIDADFMTVDSVKTTVNGTTELAFGSASVRVISSKVKFDSGMTEATGLFKCQTMQANNVVGQSYTPGAGNIW